jgi:signal transduction histidine kinase
MNHFLAAIRPVSILHSDDANLRQRLAAALVDRAYISHAPDEQRLEELLSGQEPVLLFIDLRVPGALELASRLPRVSPHAVAIALGHPGSDPYTLARDSGVYRVASLDADRETLEDLADRAIERAGWMQETQMLREELGRLRSMQMHQGAAGGRNLLSLQPLVKATRQLDPLEDMFEKIVDGVAASAMVSRVGLFYRYDGEAEFRLRASRCCLEDTESLTFNDRDPLVRWLQRSPRLVTRAGLEMIADLSERALLRRSLDLLCAEAFIPLNLRGRVLGWIFTGPSDGLPLDYGDHQELSFLSEHVVQTLENSVKHHAVVSRQKLGENLLQMMPSAIVTVDAEGWVTWSSAPVERLFPALARSLVKVAGSGSGKSAPKIPIEDLGSRIAGLVRDALAGQPAREPVIWESQASGGRTIAVRTRQLIAGGQCLGAVALIDDITDRLAAEAQAEQVERISFWRELAAGLSHEIRNPLVAIKTFTQLLPQRYTDENFRLEFKEMVTRELGRLDGIVTQIESFAHPAAPVVEAVNLPATLQEAATQARAFMDAPDAQIKIQADEGLPELRGDSRALLQAFTHLFVNGIEAAMNKKVNAHIKVRVIANAVGGEVTGVKLAIVDNGPGIAPEVLDNVFSPFCTTKAQGLGLGLPVAQRVILDHGGRLELDSGTLGLCVNITLPLAPPRPPAAPPQLPIHSAPAAALPYGTPEDEREARRRLYEARMRLGQ